MESRFTFEKELSSLRVVTQWRGMSGIVFLVFFTVFFSIYSAVNAYILVRVYRILPDIGLPRTLLIVILGLIAFSYLIGRLVERLEVCPISDLCIRVGSFWLAMMLYLFLILLAVDLLRTVDRFFPLFPAVLHFPGTETRWILFLGLFATTLSVVGAGYLNAKHPVIRHLQIPVSKPGPAEGFRIVLASDIHLGTLISNSRVDRLVEEINRENPDLVLFAGDVIDEDLKPVIQNNLGAAFLRIRSSHGVFAVNGNHEFIGGVEPADLYLNSHGVRVLRDESYPVTEFLTLLGREDRSIDRFTGGKRKKLSKILEGVDRTDALILLDHQPFHLEEAKEEGIDLQLSGHTHRGQLWPFHYLTSRIFEVDYGLARFGRTTVYVSSGYGTWGPPVRTGNRPELVVLDLQFSGGNP